ncbi:MAG: nucleotidyltransferase domain-containing protein [bacterium]
MERDRFSLELENIVGQLIEKYNPLKIILFGSLVRDEEPRDIDLFIVKENPPHIGRERIYELDRLIKYKIATDFIVYTPKEVAERLKLKDPFIKGILEEGKVLYEK